MRESLVEAYLVKRVQSAGGQAYKFKSPGRKNVPDRIVLMPNGRIRFVELKAPGERPTDAQDREHIRLWQMGFQVVVIDSTEGVDQFLKGVV